MCGSSSQQNQLEQQQAANAAQQNTFMQDYFAQYQKQLGLQSGVLAQIQANLQPILNAGINQQGFSKQELGALNTEALNQTGANYANAARAAQTAQAAGTDSTIMSGVAQQQRAAVASAAAGQTSQEELGITNANYAQGRQNYLTALGNLQNVAAMYNPQSYGGLEQGAANGASSATSAAFNEATQINQENNQWEADVAGGIMSGIGMVSGGIGNLDSTGGSSGGEQALNFLGGMF